MKDSQITTPEQLDAVIERNAISKREKLWRAAEGRSHLSFSVIAVVLGAALVIGGLFLGHFEQYDVTIQIVLGLVLIGVTLYRSQQMQIAALRELLKLNERQSS